MHSVAGSLLYNLLSIFGKCWSELVRVPRDTNDPFMHSQPLHPLQETRLVSIVPRRDTHWLVPWQAAMQCSDRDNMWMLSTRSSNHWACKCGLVGFWQQGHANSMCKVFLLRNCCRHRIWEGELGVEMVTSSKDSRIRCLGCSCRHDPKTGDVHLVAKRLTEMAIVGWGAFSKDLQHKTLDALCKVLDPASSGRAAAFDDWVATFCFSPRFVGTPVDFQAGVLAALQLVYCPAWSFAGDVDDVLLHRVITSPEIGNPGMSSALGSESASAASSEAAVGTDLLSGKPQTARDIASRYRLAITWGPMRLAMKDDTVASGSISAGQLPRPDRGAYVLRLWAFRPADGAATEGIRPTAAGAAASAASRPATGTHGFASSGQPIIIPLLPTGLLAVLAEAHRLSRHRTSFSPVAGHRERELLGSIPGSAHRLINDLERRPWTGSRFSREELAMACLQALEIEKGSASFDNKRIPASAKAQFMPLRLAADAFASSRSGATYGATTAGLAYSDGKDGDAGLFGPPGAPGGCGAAGRRIAHIAAALSDPSLLEAALPKSTTRGVLMVRPVRASLFPTPVQRAGFWAELNDGVLIEVLRRHHGEMYARLGSTSNGLALLSSSSKSLSAGSGSLSKHAVVIFPDADAFPPGAKMADFESPSDVLITPPVQAGACFWMPSAPGGASKAGAESLSHCMALVVHSSGITDIHGQVAEQNLGEDPLYYEAAGSSLHRQTRVPRAGETFQRADFADTGRGLPKRPAESHWSFVRRLASAEIAQLWDLRISESTAIAVVPVVARLPLHCPSVWMCCAVPADWTSFES